MFNLSSKTNNHIRAIKRVPDRLLITLRVIFGIWNIYNLFQCYLRVGYVAFCYLTYWGVLMNALWSFFILIAHFTSSRSQYGDDANESTGLGRPPLFSSIMQAGFMLLHTTNTTISSSFYLTLYSYAPPQFWVDHAITAIHYNTCIFITNFAISV